MVELMIPSACLPGINVLFTPPASMVGNNPAARALWQESACPATFNIISWSIKEDSLRTAWLATSMML